MAALRQVRKSFLIVWCALSFLAPTALSQDDLPDLVRRIKPSAVAIETFDARGEKLSRGSGFFIDKDRVVTNRHVIDGAYRAEVHLNSGNNFPVKNVIAVVAFGIDGDHVFYRKVVAGIQVHFGTIGAIDHVTIRDDAVLVDEETAAAGEFFAARVEGFDCDRRRLDATNEVWEIVLGACSGFADKQVDRAENCGNNQPKETCANL